MTRVGRRREKKPLIRLTNIFDSSMKKLGRGEKLIGEPNNAGEEVVGELGLYSSALEGKVTRRRQKANQETS